MITRYIVGDITETELKYIAHGVNCQNKMGSGVAKALYTVIPEVKEHYHSYCNPVGYKESLLGKVLAVKSTYPATKVVFNMFTQVEYGYDGQKYVNYSSVVECFKRLIHKNWDQVVNTGINTPKILAIPKIGCGLAGGNWTFMEQLINDTVGDKLEIWVYELEEKKNGKNDLG